MGHSLLGHSVGLFWSCPAKIISYIWGDHTIPVPYKVWGDHQIIHVGDHKSHWQLQGSHISYKVWGDHKSQWQLQCSHISYKVWGTIRVIDNYKVPAVDSKSYHTCGGGACPCSRGLGDLISLFKVQDSNRNWDSCTNFFTLLKYLGKQKALVSPEKLVWQVAERTNAGLKNYAATGDVRHMLLIQRHLVSVEDVNGDT